MAAMPVVRTQFNRQVREIENQSIIMPDGTRLSARIWLPEDAEQSPVPAIVEHLPYRKRDGTIVRDCLNHPWYAGHGYACIRVDMRGNGDSEGLMEDEYTHQELQDACDVIAWAAAQPWCSGNVGMMGISWGGFNALQVASMQPPALKAIVTVCSTVDRFADDIHFKGGCLLGENIGWAANMLSYSSRPPDPLLVGDEWRSLWLQRLEHLPLHAKKWIGKQRRDEYWQHGSVCEDYCAIKAAVLSVGGWHDGYRNTISHLVENIQAPVKGIVGPWIHKYPHYAAPLPQIGFLQESTRWWNRWLKELDTGVEDEPAYRAYLMDSVKPSRWLDERPGKWIAESHWPSPDIAMHAYNLQQHSLLAQDAESRSDSSVAGISVNSPCHCGAQTGEYFPFTYGPELPDDQQPDDNLSHCCTSDTLDNSIDIVGAPTLLVTCSVDKPLAMLAVRLCDVRPDGTSALITHGMLNLPHHQSSEHPQRLTVGAEIQAKIVLDQIAYRLPSGHKLRVSLSTQYWPFLWPSPELATVDIKHASLLVPVRAKNNNDDKQLASSSEHECQFEPAESAAQWAHQNIRPASSTRDTRTDAETGTITTFIDNDFGEDKDLDHQLVSGSKVSEQWAIHPDNPLSASVHIQWQQKLARDDWHIETLTTTHMHADNDWFYIEGSVQALENGEPVFERQYNDKIKREFV